MDGQHLKKIKINFVHEFIGPMGPIPLGYYKNSISRVFTKILEDIEDGPSKIYVNNPTHPSKFYKEEPMLVDSIIERNSNFKWLHLNKFDNPDEVRKKYSDEYFICLFESNSVCSLFDYYGNSTEELDDFLSPKLLWFIKTLPNFKLFFMDVREGSYPHSINLIEKINKFLKKHNINHKNKVIISSNNDLIKNLPKKYESSLFNSITLYNNNYNIVTAGRFITELKYRNDVIYENGYKYSLQDELNLDKKEKHFLMYNRNTSRIHRPWFVYNLYKNDLIKNGIISLMQVDDYDEFIKKEGSYDELGLTKHDIDSLRENTPHFYPMWIDESNSEKVAEFHNFLSRRNEYEKTYFSVVSETNAENYYRFLTEKTVKPIMNYHPFIIFGNPGSIKQLQELGFKTFSDYWDESYDCELNFKKRVNLIIEQIKILTEKSFDEWNEILISMEPILRHNKNLLIKMERYKKFPSDMINNITKNKNTDKSIIKVI